MLWLIRALDNQEVEQLTAGAQQQEFIKGRSIVIRQGLLELLIELIIKLATTIFWIHCINEILIEIIFEVAETALVRIVN